MNNKVYFQSIIVLCLLLLLGSCSQNQPAEERIEDIPVIPYPQKVLKRSDYIILNNNFWVITDVGDTAMARLGQYLVEQIDQIPGALGSIADLYSTRNHEQAIQIELVEDPELHNQGYRLTITSKKMQIQGVSEQGIYYGIQTILSLLRNQWDAATRTAQLRKMVIIDYPQTPYRTVDLSLVKDSINISNLIELLGQLKINSVILPPKNKYLIDSTELAAKYISWLRRSQVSQDKVVHLPAKPKQLEQLLSQNSLANTDSIVYQIHSFLTGEKPYNLMVAGQLSWCGSKKKSFEWLNEQIIESQSFTTQ